MTADSTRIIVFRNRLRPESEPEYSRRAQEVYALAEKMPGFVSSKDFAADDGERLTVIEFDSPEHLAAWREHAEHRIARGEGRTGWYAEYRLQICALLRESRFELGRDSSELPDYALRAPVPVDLEGGCACRAVRYRVRGVPRSGTLCHCTDCRLACGATPVAWATFRASELEWTAGAPRTRASSERATREFCSACGTQLTFRYVAQPDWADVTLASLDAPDAVAPVDHTWTRSKPAWTRLLDELPRFERTRDG
jgi:heme-degrading monooxygenase HmoA